MHSSVCFTLGFALKPKLNFAGSFMFLFALAYGLCFWFAGWLIVRDRNDNPSVCRVPLPPTDECMTGGVANNVLLSVLIGMLYLSHGAPSIAAFFTAKTKVARIIALKELAPEIDVSSESGNKVGLDKVRGRITFKEVTFAFPTRPEYKVLDKFSLEIDVSVCSRNATRPSSASCPIT